MTVDELGQRMGQAEFIQWIAFFSERARREEDARKEAEKKAKRRRR